MGRRRRGVRFGARGWPTPPTLPDDHVLLCQPDRRRVEVDELGLVGQQLAGRPAAVLGAERRGQLVEAVPPPLRPAVVGLAAAVLAQRAVERRVERVDLDVALDADGLGALGDERGVLLSPVALELLAGERGLAPEHEDELDHARPSSSAIPWPPPMHSVTRPTSCPPRSISSRHLAVMTAPVAPIGCPRATAPPFGLTLAGSRSSSFMTARAWAAKASLSSMTPMSSRLSPALSSARLTAGTGPMPMIDGSTPAVAYASTRARTGAPSSWALSSLSRVTAAPASFMPLALPAVTVPSGLKTGLSLPITSALASGRMCSSLVNSTVSRLTLTGTGTIASSKRPAS